MSVAEFRPDWHADAACASLIRAGQAKPWHWWPGPHGLSVSNRQAVEVCLTECPVRDDCLAAALRVPTRDDCLIFGGLSERARRRIRTGHTTIEHETARALRNISTDTKAAA